MPSVVLGDITTRIIDDGFLDSSRGIRRWADGNVFSGTQGDPTIVRIDGDYEVGHGLDLSRDRDGVPYRYVIWIKKPGGRFIFRNKDSAPYKMVDEWGRVGVWT